MADDLVQLARQLVELDAKTRELRAKMLALLVEAPARPTSAAGLNGGAGQKQGKAEADEAVLEVLRQAPAPMRQIEVARATGQPVSTTGNRLARLREQSRVTLSEGLWSATAVEASASST
jgi:hypothetical protein